MPSDPTERERPNPAEPPELTDPVAGERGRTAFVRETVDEAGVDGVDLHPSLVARFAEVVCRSESERTPPSTPTDRSHLRSGGGR